MSKCKENYPVKYHVDGILITQSGTQHQCYRVQKLWELWKLWKL
jgi:hypothetical protein